MRIFKSTEMYDFTKEELQEIYDMRLAYQELDEREKFLVREALGVFFYSEKKK